MRFAKTDPLTERVVDQVLLGISRRRHEKSLESLPPPLVGRETSMSAVSRTFVAATRSRVEEELSKLLFELDPAVLDAHRRFRRLKRHREMPLLLEALDRLHRDRLAAVSSSSSSPLKAIGSASSSCPATPWSRIRSSTCGATGSITPSPTSARKTSDSSASKPVALFATCVDARPLSQAFGNKPTSSM